MLEELRLVVCLENLLVDHSTMVEKILKFQASRHQQNVCPRLKALNQVYISWRGTFNKLKS